MNAHRVDVLAARISNRCQWVMDAIDPVMDLDKSLSPELRQKLREVRAMVNEARWDAVVVALMDRHPYSLACQVGECDTKLWCPVCRPDHLKHGVNPPCVDHG